MAMIPKDPKEGGDQSPFISIAQNMGLGQGSKKSQPKPIGLPSLPMLAEIGYRNYKAREEGGMDEMGGPVDRVKNRVARSAPGLSKGIFE